MIPKSLSVALMCVLSVSHLAAQDDLGPERWDRVVALQTKKDKSVKHASGFFVKTTDALFLVTAQHAAVDTTGETRILYLRASGESRWMVLRGLVAAGSNPWTQYENNDLAIAQIDPVKDAAKVTADLRQIAVPFEALLETPAVRATEIEFVGFPLAFGTLGGVSSLVVCGHIASRELQSKGDWGEMPIVYATPAVASGTSGGPVMQRFDSPHEVAIVGMYIAVAVDETGAKLSKLVPARVIREAVKAASSPPVP